MTTYEEHRKVYTATGMRINIERNLRTAMENKMVETWCSGEIWEHGRCIICGKQMEDDSEMIEVAEVKSVYQSTVCDECESIAADHYERNGENQIICQTPEWDKQCPERFRRLVNGELNPSACSSPAFNQESFNKVLSWNYGEQGMVLIGPSGAGKTYSLWALFRKLELAGIVPTFTVSSDLSRTLSLHAKEMQKPTDLWRTKVLIIDDMGKEKITASAASHFWELMNERYQWALPTLITTRFNGDDFIKMFDEKLSENGKILMNDIRRRINNTCKPVVFG